CVSGSLCAKPRNVLESLSPLSVKPIPADIDLWNNRSASLIIGYLQQTPTDSASVQAYRRARNDRITGFRVELDARDRTTIDRYRAEFVTDGLETRYSSLGRNNRMEYPTFVQLTLAADRPGKAVGYLAEEDAFQFVRSMQLRDRIVPV